MKPLNVAIHAADPYMSGVYKLVWEFRDGLRDLGHKADVTTSSRSGKTTVRWGNVKGGSLWWSERPDVCVKNEKLADLFDAYDLVILADLRFVRSDQDALKRGGTPAYVVAVERTRTPVTCIAHGVPYDDRSAVFMDRVIGADSFTGVLLGTSAPYSYEEHPVFSKFDVHLPLERMYGLKLRDAEVPYGTRSAQFGTFGRFGTGKNLHLVGLAAAFRTREITHQVEVHGACASMMTETPSYALLDTLVQRYGFTVMSHLVPDGDESPEYKDYRWGVGSDDYGVVYYGGSYTDPLKVARRMETYVNVTRHGFSAGMEYATLEAMDAGCQVVVPRGMRLTDDRYQLNLFDDPVEARATARGSAVHDEKLVDRLAYCIDKSKQVSRVAEQRRAQHNREAIREFHHPAKVAERTLERLSDWVSL